MLAATKSNARRGAEVQPILIFQVLLSADSHHTDMPDRPTWRHRLGGAENSMRINTIVSIEVGDGPSLPEMLDAQ